jgi:hypothetical protein
MYMEFNIDYNLVMYILVGIVIVFIIFSIIGSGKVVEGITNKKQTKSIYDLLAEGDYKQLTKIIQKMDDILLVDKYRTDYEDTLVSLEEALNQNILMNLLVIASEANTDKGLTSIKPEELEGLNMMYKLRDNLSSTMDYIDGKKSDQKSSSLF